MPAEDRTAAFLRYVAERRCVRGSRGAVVRLARWHAPMVGREHGERVPPLRNRWDVRTWARKAGAAALPRAVDQFTREADRLWLQFCGALEADGCGREAVADARSLVELDADARRAADAALVVKAWVEADALRDKAVTAAALCAVEECRQAIGAAMRPARAQDQVTASIASAALREIAGRGWGWDGWRVGNAVPDRHRKLARFRLSTTRGGP